MVLNFEVQEAVQLRFATLLTEDRLTAHGAKRQRTHRWILANILSDAGSLSDGVAEFVAIDTEGSCVLGFVANAAVEDELLLFLVLYGIQ